MNVFLKKEILETKNITNEGIAVYFSLRKMFFKDLSNYFVSINMISYYLTGNLPTREMKECIKQGIINLSDIGLISIIDEPSKEEYILDLSNLYFDSKKTIFIILDSDDFHKIMTFKSKFTLMKYYTEIVMTYNHSHSVDGKKFTMGYTSVENLALKSGISERTAYTYNQILENMGIMYIHRSGDYTINDGNIKRVSNLYGNIKDKESIIQYADRYNNAIGSSKSTKKANIDEGNYKKSMLMKYNSLCGGKEYDESTINEIHEFILAYNEELDEKIRSYEKINDSYSLSQIELYEGKKRDTNIFHLLASDSLIK